MTFVATKCGVATQVYPTFRGVEGLMVLHLLRFLKVVIKVVWRSAKHRLILLPPATRLFVQRPTFISPPHSEEDDSNSAKLTICSDGWNWLKILFHVFSLQWQVTWVTWQETIKSSFSQLPCKRMSKCYNFLTIMKNEGVIFHPQLLKTCNSSIFVFLTHHKGH